MTGGSAVRIGIISDTHGNLPVRVHEAFAGVGHILHAGDIGGQIILDELETIAPVTAVWGNCDYFGDYLFEDWARVVLDGTSIFMTHTPRDLGEALRGIGPYPPNTPLPHVAIHGHTHVPRQQRIGPTLYLCPGSPVRPRNGSAPTVMLLDTHDGIITSVEQRDLITD
jgi:putative phosphoesterase